MNQYGYLVAAYLAAGGLYGGYLAVLQARRRSLVRAAQGRSALGSSSAEGRWDHGRVR